MTRHTYIFVAGHWPLRHPARVWLKFLQVSVNWWQRQSGLGTLWMTISQAIVDNDHNPLGKPDKTARPTPQILLIIWTFM